jgi:hypothetical protein
LKFLRDRKIHSLEVDVLYAKAQKWESESEWPYTFTRGRRGTAPLCSCSPLPRGKGGGICYVQIDK